MIFRVIKNYMDVHGKHRKSISYDSIADAYTSAHNETGIDFNLEISDSQEIYVFESIGRDTLGRLFNSLKVIKKKHI